MRSGQQTSDTVTVLGAGVDGSVRRIEYNMIIRDNQYLITSFDAVTGGNIVSQEMKLFNGFRQLQYDYQSAQRAGERQHDVTAATLQLRLDRHGQPLDQHRLPEWLYGQLQLRRSAGSVQDVLSILTSISDYTGVLESYGYLGLGTILVRNHPQTGVNQTITLDSQGRVQVQEWYNSSTGQAVSDLQYGYNANSDRTYANNLVDAAFSEVYTNNAVDALTGHAARAH